ncbi:MAG TPA: AraC family ligand binding domain-containing protein [Candidatus Eisenbacteria bacterium]|nr:AraC family ligand binding domain-containing protein [Candidatus Eisenbacteria bacterium]
MEHRPLGWEQLADCGAMRVVGLRLAAGQRVPEHRNALPLAIIVTRGLLRYSEAASAGEARAGELVLINPGERHTYWADEETTAYMVFAGLPGARARPWSLRRR